MRKYYSYGQFNRYNSSHREMQDYLEDLLRKYRPSSDFFLSHAQVGDRCVLNVFARSGEWIVIGHHRGEHALKIADFLNIHTL